MGWETLAIVGFQAISGIQGMKAANSQAKGIAREGEYAAQTTADNTIRSTGKLQTSFLQSGLTLEGGPMDVLKSAFSKGYTDIGRIKSNADAGAKNVVSAARTKALQGLASSAAGAAGAAGLGGAANDLFTTAGSYLPDSFAYGLNDLGFGQSATDMLIKSDTRAGLY